MFPWLRRFLPWQRSSQSSPCSSETAKFILLAAKSGLREAAELNDAFGAFRHKVPTPHVDGCAELREFCNYLVRNDLLTHWQCEKLLQGCYKGFFMDNFKLLHHVGCEGTCSVYTAEDVHRKRRVMLRVFPHPVKKRDDGHPYYEVDETTDPR